MSWMKVFLCSPFRADSEGKAQRNRTYLLDALRDCLARGEAPFAPHAVYPLVLNDSIETQRQAGIAAGVRWLEAAELVAVYADHGISDGMRAEMDVAMKAGVPVEVRMLSEGTRSCG